MLLVRQPQVTVAVSSGYQVQGLGSSEEEEEGVEGDRKDMRVETLKGPVGQNGSGTRGRSWNP